MIHYEMAWYLSRLESQIHTLKVGGSSPPHTTKLDYMEKQEAIDIINKKNDHKEDWFFKSDQKKFGFGMPRKNRNSKRGYSNGTKETRKLERQMIRAERHQMLKAGLLNLES